MGKVDKAKVYPVMTLSLDDVIQLDDWQDDGKQRYEKIWESLDDYERQSVAEYIGDWLYDGDRWDEALSCALNNKERKLLKIDEKDGDI